MSAPITQTLTGELYSIVQRVTRQGRRWASTDIVFNDPAGVQVRHEVQIYPNAYEHIGEHLVAGASATITAAGFGTAQHVTIAGHDWRGDIAASVVVGGLRLPHGPDPIPVAQVLQAVKRDAGHLFNPRWLPGSRKPKLSLLLFLMQGHHLAFCHKPLFDAPIYATEAGVSVVLPDPAGEFPSNFHWGTVGQVLSRYEGMHLADLRSLVRASTAWQAARTGSAEVDHGLLDEWFSRDEECNDPDSETPTRAVAARVDAEFRAGRQVRQPATAEPTR